jgi:hypothetical protein
MSKISTIGSALCVALVAGVAAPAMADFTYNDFSTAPGMTMVGGAQKATSSIMLTPVAERLAGAAWVDAKQNVSLGFDTTIKIRIPERLGAGADGFALVIQNSAPHPMGGTGGGIGYGDNEPFGQPGIANSLAVELDLWNNSPTDWPDLSNSHISVQSRGLLPNSPSQDYSLGSVNVADPSDGLAHTMRVRYTPGVMDIFFDGALSPTLSVNVNLASLLTLDTNGGTTAGQAWVGITAATGGGAAAQGHELMAWSFNGTSIPAPGAAAFLGLGGLALARRRR